MKFHRATALAAACAIVFLAASVSAGPESDVMKMVRAYHSAHSFHAEIVPHVGQPIGIDYVAPDRFRGTLAGNVHAVFIGEDTWVQTRGRTIKLPGFKVRGYGSMNAIWDQYWTAVVSGVPAKAYDISDDGTDPVNGIPAHAYTLRRRAGGNVVKVWVGRNCLPIQEVIAGNADIYWSQFNAPMSIEPP